MKNLKRRAIILRVTVLLLLVVMLVLNFLEVERLFMDLIVVVVLITAIYWNIIEHKIKKMTTDRGN